MGPFSKAPGGFKFLCVAVNKSTKRIEPEPIREITATTMIKVHASAGSATWWSKSHKFGQQNSIRQLGIARWSPRTASHPGPTKWSGEDEDKNSGEEFRERALRLEQAGPNKAPGVAATTRHSKSTGHERPRPGFSPRLGRS